MDNITHTLVGIAVAESIYLLTKKKNQPETTPTFKKSFYLLLAIVAASFPDVDILAQLYDSSKLNYLLTHRGYTHTFLAIVPQGLLLLGFFFIYLKFKKIKLSTKHWLVSASIVFINLFLHMFLDYLNTYGIHPFSPFNDRWYYGDLIHIIEPLIWLSLMPLALYVVSNKPLKGFFIFALIAVPLLLFKVGFMSIPSIVFVYVFFSLIVYALQFLKPSGRLVFSWTCFALLVCMFFTYKSWTTHKVNQFFTNELGHKPVDIVLSPIPNSPFCWYVIAVDIVDDEYHLDYGDLSHYGASCKSFISATGNQLQEPLLKNSEGLTWKGSYRVKIKDFFKDYERSCTFRYWMQFARVPARRGSRIFDYRFAPKRKKDITIMNLDLPGADECPKIKTDWVPPRQDLLEAYINLNKQPSSGEDSSERL